MKRLVLVIINLLFIFNITFSQSFFKIKKFYSKVIPVAVAADEKNNIYIADQISHAIIKYNEKGKYLFTFGLKTPKVKSSRVYEIKPSRPVDIFIKNDLIYVLDLNNGILVFNLDGSEKGLLKYITGNLLGEVKGPMSLYVDNDYIYITDTQNNRIQSFNLKGEIISSFGYRGAMNNSLNLPSGISKYRKNFIVADTGNNRVSIFDKNGFSKKIIGNENVVSSDSGIFKYPEDIFVDNLGYIYIVDTGNERIQVYDGNFELYASIGKKGKFKGIKDVWVSDKYIYIAESINNSVKVFDRKLKLKRVVGKSILLNKILSMLLLGLFFLIIYKILSKKKQTRYTVLNTVKNDINKNIYKQKEIKNNKQENKEELIVVKKSENKQKTIDMNKKDSNLEMKKKIKSELLKKKEDTDKK